MKEFTSTIAAISTPPGKGGVAIIRVSGDDALGILNKVFKPRYNSSLVKKDDARRMIYGDIYSEGEPIDDGLAVYFPAPASYTGEDMVEINCHGGLLITRAVLEAVLTAGAIQAEAGEFTRRAFVNGRLTLTETEAIGLMLEAKTRGQLKLSSAKSRSLLTKRLTDAEAELTSLLADIYARIDYPDEELGDFTNDECTAILSAVQDKLTRLSETYKLGHAICEGIPTVICGLTNAGKSTLYNLIAGDDYAIVTDIPGTTRDVLEREVSVGDILIRLHDTAGIREGSIDTVEKIGIDRSLAKINDAELILFLIDIGVGLSTDNAALIKRLEAVNAKKIALVTKCDSDEEIPEELYWKLSESFDRVISISARDKQAEAKSKLQKIIEELFISGDLSISNDAVILNARQNATLTRALDFISNALDAFSLGLPQDICSSDIELALGQISELDGRAVSEAVVSDIFKRFCVGK